MTTILALYSYIIATMGYIPKVGNTTSHNHRVDDPKDVELCQNVSDALRLNSQLMLSGWENLMNQTFGITTRKYQEFDQKWTAALDYTGQKIKNLYQRRLDGTLTEKEQNCYCNVAYDRYEAQQQQQQDATLKKKKEEEEERFTLDEVEAIMGGLLAAGVDTTGGMLSFRLLHLASSPEIQDKLYHALQPTLDVHGQLTRESLDLPYLHQILRESHRMGSSVITAPIKTLQTDMVVHGHLLPKGCGKLSFLKLHVNFTRMEIASAVNGSILFLHNIRGAKKYVGDRGWHQSEWFVWGLTRQLGRLVSILPLSSAEEYFELQFHIEECRF